MSLQANWRFCRKCSSMFYDGYPNKGNCPGGDGHEALGYNFTLSYNIPATPTAQDSWRFCRKCNSMFYDGYREKGNCPTGGSHEAAGYNFVLSHDTIARTIDQDSWRFCHKCNSIFYDGYPEKGICSTGGVHEAAGYNFVLAHDLLRQPIAFEGPIIFPEGIAITANYKISITPAGDISTWTHAHCSSKLVTYDYGIVIIISTQNGLAIGIQHSGHVSNPLIGSVQDDDWSSLKNELIISNNWDQFSQATIVAITTSSDTQILGHSVTDLLSQALEEAGIAAVAILIA